MSEGPASPQRPFEPPRPDAHSLPTSAAASSVLTTVGDIAVTSDSVITPNGAAPLLRSRWVVTDMSRTESRIPPYAIVLAVIFALACLLGLLFLLVREKVTTGYVQVWVGSGGFQHSCQIPVSSPEQVQQIRQQVAYVQSMTGAG